MKDKNKNKKFEDRINLLQYLLTIVIIVFLMSIFILANVINKFQSENKILEEQLDKNQEPSYQEITFIIPDEIKLYSPEGIIMKDLDNQTFSSSEVKVYSVKTTQIDKILCIAHPFSFIKIEALEKEGELKRAPLPNDYILLSVDNSVSCWNLNNTYLYIKMYHTYTIKNKGGTLKISLWDKW